MLMLCLSLGIIGIHLALGLRGSGLPPWLFRGSLCLSSPWNLDFQASSLAPCPSLSERAPLGDRVQYHLVTLPSPFKCTFKGPLGFLIKIQMNFEH